MSTRYRALEASDKIRWSALFDGYCEFYEYPISEKRSATVWEWLMDDQNPCECRVADSDDFGVIGLAHYNPRPDSLDGNYSCYLADLFVDPKARGLGIGDGLYRDVMDICRQRGWDTLNLLTHYSNKQAQKVYDRYGAKTDFYWYSTTIDLGK